MDSLVEAEDEEDFTQGTPHLRSLSAADCAEIVLGERWTLRILHELMRGTHRFHDIQIRIGAAPNMVSARLRTLKRAGLVDRQRYRNKPARYEYHLTQMGAELEPVILSIETWADRWREPLKNLHDKLAG